MSPFSALALFAALVALNFMAGANSSARAAAANPSNAAVRSAVIDARDAAHRSIPRNSTHPHRQR
jgi:hypothetical protein